MKGEKGGRYLSESAEGEKMPFRRTFLHSSTHKNTNMYRHSYSSSKTIDMTEGSVFLKLVLFSIPLMITNLLQMLYNAADMMVVSLSHEPSAVGAIGMTGAFINLVINVFMGFATGANVMVARHIGAKDGERTSRTMHTAIVMSVGFGLVSMIIGLFISRPVLSLMGAEGKLLDLATTYTFIYFLGVPFVSLVNYLISIFRAKGDTRTPLYILSASGLLNVILNLFFVLVCKMSVEGVALATSISNIVSGVFLLLKLCRDDGPCQFSFKKLCFDRMAFRDILHIGLPAAVQGSLFSISNMLIQSSIIRMNYILTPPGTDFDPVVNGNAAAANLEGFAYTAENTIYQAAISFTSQNAGAKKHKRIYRIMGSCYVIGACVATFFALSLFFLRAPLLSLYGVKAAAQGSAEAIAYNTATTRMLFMFMPYALISYMEIGCGIVRGLGKSLSSTIISLLGACAFRVFWVLVVFDKIETLESIYISYPISWLMTGTVFLIYSLSVLRKAIKKQNTETIEV